MTRVLVVSDVSGWMAGGVPAETRHLLEGLAARDHIVAYAGDVALSGPEVEHHAIDLTNPARLLARFEAVLSAFRPQIVHVMAMGSRALMQVLPALARHTWLCTVHSIPPHERKLGWFHAHERLHYAARAVRFAPNALAWDWLFRRRAMPHVVVHSPFVRDIALRRGADPSRVSVVPLGADVSGAAGPSAASSEAGPRLVCVAGLAHTKGQHDLIAALPEIARHHPGVSCCLIGEVRDPSYVRYCARLASRLGVAQRVERLEGLGREALLAKLREADLYVQPSHEEGFCLAFIEAASLALRLVGTDTGAIAAVAEGDDRMRVIPPRSPAALARAALELLACHVGEAVLPARRARLAARFAWSRYLDAHEALYARLESAHGDAARLGP